MLRAFPNATLCGPICHICHPSRFAAELVHCSHRHSWITMEGDDHLNLLWEWEYSEITVKSSKCLFSIFSTAERVRKALSQSCCLLIRCMQKTCVTYLIWNFIVKIKIR